MPDPSPFVSLARHTQPRISTKAALLSLSRSIEARAVASGPDVEMWVCLQHHQNYGGVTRRTYEELAARGVRIHLYGTDIRIHQPTPLEPPSPWQENTSFHDISEFGALVHEWNVLLVADDAALALTARQCDPAPPANEPTSSDKQRRFEWLISENRADIIYAAASLPPEPFVINPAPAPNRQ